MNFAHNHYQKKSRQRTLILALFLGFWIFGIVLRLFYLQVLSHSKLRSEVLEQNQSQRVILPQRGTIFDRNGKILARSIPAQSVFYIPLKKESVESQMATLGRLKEILNLSFSDLEKIRSKVEKKAHFIWIKRKVDSTQAASVKGLGLNGVFTQQENKRFYPLGVLASQILGGVNIDDAGLGGIEYKYNSVLQGKKGQCLILRDARKREYHLEIIKEPESGKDIVLTIDETIQYIAERELEKAVLENGAKWGTVIITHPLSGEVLAMASIPAYDPNHYPPASPEAEINRGIRHNFEPGSTFKIITACAALENRSISSNESFDCREGLITVAGRPFRDHKKLGILSFPEVFIHSSNVGAIQVGQKIGENPLYETIKAFRFGLKTGIDLPGEESGIFPPLRSWSKRSLASLSIGYEISVTAMQILQAMNVIINHGIPVSPRVVKEISGFPERAKQNFFQAQPVISNRAASELISILERAVLEGTGQEAQAAGYSIAGKTGTTQKFDPALGRYSSLKHIASFVGFVPVEKPAISMIVVLDEPQKTDYYGGQVAAPLFREIAQRVLRYLHLFPQEKKTGPVITAKARKEDDR